jgi:hypothetical protein
VEPTGIEPVTSCLQSWAESFPHVAYVAKARYHGEIAPRRLPYVATVCRKCLFPACSLNRQAGGSRTRQRAHSYRRVPAPQAFSGTQTAAEQRPEVGLAAPAQESRQLARAQRPDTPPARRERNSGSAITHSRDS